MKRLIPVLAVYAACLLPAASAHALTEGHSKRWTESNSRPARFDKRGASASRPGREPSARVATTAELRTVFTGSLLGHDGRPMAKAHVHVSRFNQSKPLASVEAGKDGGFALATAETGLLQLRLTGVGHRSRQVALLVDKPARIGLDARLKTYDYLDDFGEVEIIGDFNDFSFKSASAMERQPDGTFAAEFDTSAGRFSYQLVGVTGDGSSINGTQSEEYVYDGGGDYRSVVTPRGGRVRVVFDPKALQRSDAPARLIFRDAGSAAARFVAVYEAMLRRRERLSAALAAHKKAGRPLDEFGYDWSRDLAELSWKIRKERTPLLRQALLVSYLDLGYGVYGAELDAATARKVLTELAPTSPLWSIEPTLVAVAVNGTGRPEGHAPYVRQVIDSHPDPAVVRAVKAELSPERRIAPGKTVPSFTLASLDQPGSTYTGEALRGKVVLIDFWATWCGPCIEEMPNLHQEYEKFKGLGFEILSVSLDENREDVEKFRRERWKMPWLNALLSSNPEVKKQFELVGIPKAVLVDRDGRVVVTDKELRGRSLDRTLRRVLGAPE